MGAEQTRLGTTVPGTVGKKASEYGIFLAANVDRDSDGNIVVSCASEGGPSMTVKTIHISCKSDVYHAGKSYNYGGVIVYGYDGEQDWYTANGTHCKSGYLVIQDSSSSAVQKYRSESGQIHGAIYRNAFGESANKKVIAEGFAVMGGDFRINSGVFNMNDEYHDERRRMHEITERCVSKVVECWKSAGSDFTKCQNYTVKDL